jgi:hypothetical protein
MEYNYSLNVKDQVQMYIFAYYNQVNLWFLRRFSGPILIVIALLFVIIDRTNLSIMISIAISIIGIAFIIRPFVLIKRMHFEPTNVKMTINESGIIIKNEIGEAKITNEKIIDILLKKQYLLIKVKMTTMYYLFIDMSILGSKSNELFKELKQKINKIS